jgi:hypothetical protein
MTVPAHLDTSAVPYEYHQHTGLVDVETGGVGIITDTRLYLVTNKGWTEPSTALFQSPADSLGRWIDVLLTRIVAGTLEIRMRDHKGHTIFTRRIHIDVAGTAVNYWSSKMFHRVEALRATPELFWCEMVETSPDDPGAIGEIAIGSAFSSTGDVNDNLGQPTLSGFMWETDNAAAANRNDRGTPATTQTTGTAVGLIMGDGTLLYEDACVFNQATGTTNRVIGRLYHAMLGDSSVAFGTDKPGYVDDAVTATFRCAGFTTSGATRLFYRKSDP